MFHKIIFSAFVILTCVMTADAYAGKMELTTYYPAPYGEYQELRSTSNSYFATSGGNVGIGTENPGAKLEVKAGAAGQGSPATAIKIWGPNAPANSNSAQDLQWGFSAAGSSRIRAYRGGSWDTYLQFLTNPAAPAGDDPQVRMHISGNGNVGIGTTSPANKLTIMSPGEGSSGSPFRMFSIRNPTPTGAPDQFAVEFELAKTHILNTRNNVLTLNRAGGNVGIGITDPIEKLHVRGDIRAEDFIYAHNGPMWAGFGCTTTDAFFAGKVGHPLYFGFTDTKDGTGDPWMEFRPSDLRIYLYRAIMHHAGYELASDARIKLDQTPLNRGLNDVLKLKPKSYMRLAVDNDMAQGKTIIDPDITKGKKEIGLVAQEVYEVIPEIVTRPESEEKDLWSLNYNGMIPVLVKAVQEQQAQIELLKKEIEALKKVSRF